LEQLNESLDEDKVNVVVMLLTGTIKLWWRNQVEDLVDWRIIEQIENYTNMKASLKAHFGLRTKHGSQGINCWLQSYIKEFTWLMSEIKYMSKEDKIFYFMNGLQLWAQREL
jgi:hypothetical protein